MKNEFLKVLAAANDVKVCVSLDWLSILFEDPYKSIPVPAKEGEPETFDTTSNLKLEYVGGGSQHFKFIYNVLDGADHVATILAYTRSKKFVKEGTVKVDFKNHVLYSSDLWPLYDKIQASFRLIYKNISRVDIAMDGANYLLDFMNLYAKQEQHYKEVDRKGLATFSAKVQDKRTMQFQNFRIGGSKGRKEATIYNKSLDIVKSGKNYIQEYWHACGIVNRLMPLDALAKQMDGEKMYVDGYSNVFRFEIRLRGERILEIKNFSIDMLKTANGLVSIMKLMCERFFDFIWIDAVKQSECSPINILPWHQFDIIPMEKNPKKERSDLYKTKLAINKNVKQLYLGDHATDSASVFEMLVFDINRFDLSKWFWKKFEKEWQYSYGKLTTPDRKEEIRMFLEDVFERTITPEIDA